MGCCVSSIDKDPPPPSHFHRHSSFSKSSRSRAPPPIFDEETVKEVLSETPSPKVLYSPKPQPDEPKKQKSLPKIQEATKNNVTQKPNSIITPTTEVSEEPSEICSSILSESVSTTTMTTFNNDVSGEFCRQRLTGGSPAKYRNRPVSGEVKREKAVGKSPIRGSDRQSPGRIRPGNGRDQPRRVENSGPVQRSRSPANHTDVGGGSSTRNGVGRSPSVRKTGKSPSRVGSDLHEKTRRGRESTASTNESLENPLVSLECFIFL